MNHRAYISELVSIIDSLPPEKRTAFVATFQEREKNPIVAFGLNVFLGTLGIDRFYLGQTMLGIIKLLTLGGAGIWVLIDYFLVAGKARDLSMDIARQLKTSMV
jgi:TM2 domain-containing membrane protein YozV